MPDQQEIADLVRSRLRNRRVELGLSIDELAATSLVNASTISRIETGRRVPGLHHLVPLATALGLGLDELVTPPEPSDVVIRPETEHADGVTYWRLTREEQPGLPRVVKMALPPGRRPPAELPTHPGREWAYVLSGTLRIVLGTHQHLVPAGSSASFDTSIPHWLGAHEGPTELLCIFDLQGERSHLPAP
jgi:transcriptional regulator with XRE-family HTH domain